MSEAPLIIPGYRPSMKAERLASGMLGANLTALGVWSMFWNGRFKEVYTYQEQSIAKGLFYRPSTVLGSAAVGWLGGIVVGSMFFGAARIGSSGHSKEHH